MTKNLTNPEKDAIIEEEPCDFCKVHCGNPWCVTRNKRSKGIAKEI